MCGIGAFQIVNNEVDPSKVARVLARLLQVRGTDASGVAWHDNGGTFINKSNMAGAELARHLGNDVGTTGIVHTRWATQGSPENTTPHLCMLDNAPDICPWCRPSKSLNCFHVMPCLPASSKYVKTACCLIDNASFSSSRNARSRLAGRSTKPAVPLYAVHKSSCSAMLCHLSL